MSFWHYLNLKNGHVGTAAQACPEQSRRGCPVKRSSTGSSSHAANSSDSPSLYHHAAVSYAFFSAGGNYLRYLDRLQPLALFVMRLVLGAIILDHGYHKVFGGLQHHVQLVTSLGLPAWSAYLSAFTEFFGGLLVLLGLFTRVAALRFASHVGRHRQGALPQRLMGNGGYEFPLALATLAFALVFFGGGPIAFDHIRAPAGGGWKSK